MTEAEWPEGTDIQALYLTVCRTTSARKLRLFACACCDRIAHLIDDDRSHSALATVRRAADSLADSEELQRALDATMRATNEIGRRVIVSAFGEEEYTRLRQRERTASSGPTDTVYHAAEANPAFQAAWAVRLAAGPHRASYVINVASVAAEAAVRARAELHAGDYSAALERERAMLCSLWRDVHSNPFRPVAFSPEWRTDTALTLARQMYEAREFGAMPILADALQDAGCDNEDILNHCRSEAPHVRGCWVVDLVLGKE
jgi:hypothetical protein